MLIRGYSAVSCELGGIMIWRLMNLKLLLYMIQGVNGKCYCDVSLSSRGPTRPEYSLSLIIICSQPAKTVSALVHVHIIFSF